MEGKGPSQIAAQLEKERCLTPPHTNTLTAERHRIKHWRMNTVGTKVQLLTFLSIWSTQAVRSISKPTPTPFWTRSRGTTRWRIARFSTTSIRRSFLWKSLIRCRKSDSSDTAERQRARAICSLAWCSVTTANRSSITPPPTTLRSDKTSLSAPLIAPTKTSVADIISVPLCLNNRSGSIFKKSYRW